MAGRGDPAGNTVHILFVDDEPSLRLLGQKMLERCGFAVTVAANGQEALDLYRSNSGTFGLIVTDLQMPDYDGHELLQKLREAGATMPVILMSGYGDSGSSSDVQTDAEQLGFAGVLPKPFRMEQLDQAIRSALGG